MIKKVKSFTLSELIVVMIITVIVVGIVYIFKLNWTFANRVFR
ncbi:prepilin-type N-terminal cleavage/methylation domain-containing protein [Flavobacterium sp.]